MKYLTERVMKLLFLIAACASILAVALICVFLFSSGVPAIGKIGVYDFLLGMKWKPLSDIYGIFPMIVGSIYVTAGSLVIGVPIGILCAVFMARFCPRRLYGILKPAVNLLAGIPSIVYGFFGLVVIVPLMQDMFDSSGKGLLTASILLGIMILPTDIQIAESSIRSCPRSKIGYHRRRDFGPWPRHRRDDGRHHGGREPGRPAERSPLRRAHDDGQYCS
jgi:phosphate transport system permease protein